MDAILKTAAGVRGTLSVPPDKAICHRAVLIAAAARGQTVIQPWPDAEDCQRTLALIQGLGVPVRKESQTVQITGQGPNGLRAPAGELFCGESGTTFRLGAGLLAGQPFRARLAAGPSLCRRPMRRIAEPLRRMGARVDGVAAQAASSAEGAAEADGEELYPPLTIQGRRPLRALRYELPVASAQVKSAVLLAALAAEGRTVIVERTATRDHTERLLGRCGLRCERVGLELVLEPGVPLAPGTLTLPGDVSSAAFFLVAAACVPGSQVRVEGVGLNPTRVSLLAVLARMGAQVRVETTDEEADWEPRGAIEVAGGRLSGITVEPDQVPGLIDELPILMVAAACATGLTRLSGLRELRVKETDRLGAMVQGLLRLGARVRCPAPDVVEIAGGAPLVGSDVDSEGDHRTAMSLAVAGLVARGTTRVRQADCVAKSFPTFFEQLRQLAGADRVAAAPSDGKNR
jgi:3-phosphoshikimate 1-carboxyvinyltransferase